MFKKILFGLVAALAFGGVLAQAVPATDPVPRVTFPVTRVGNISTVGPRTADASNAAKFSFGVASNGAVFANTGDRLATPGGQSIPIGVNGSIAKPKVAAALGRFATKVIVPLNVGMALYDLGQELGYGLDNSSGDLIVTKVIDASTYSVVGGNTCSYMTGVHPLAQWVTWSQECYGGTFAATPYNGTGYEVCRTTGGFCHYLARVTSGTSNSPSTVGAFQDAIAAKSGWPSSSALARATVDAIKSGEVVQVEPQTISGPSSSPGPSSTTHNATNNTTTVSVTTNNHTYAGPNVTTTSVTNRTTVDNNTSTVIAEEEITDSPVIPEPQTSEPLCGAPGLPPCNVKVDETGTPPESSATSRFGQAVIDLGTVQEDATESMTGVEDITLPEWTWTFSFPSGCTPMVLPAFDDFEIDVCQFQPMIHDIMSVLWVIAGIWGLISLFMRATGV